MSPLPWRILKYADDLRNFLLLQGREGRHSRAGDSIADDAGQFAVHGVLHIGAVHVRCVFPAAAIRTMTTGAIGREDCGARRLRLQRRQQPHPTKTTRTKMPRRQPIFVTGPLRSA